MQVATRVASSLGTVTPDGFTAVMPHTVLVGVRDSGEEWTGGDDPATL